MKIVRPVLPEMEDFHAALYVLYHYQMSPFQLDKAAGSIQTLQARMDALDKAALPERLKAKTESFNVQRERLSKSVADVAAALAARDETKIKAAIEIMHTHYENLERVF